MNRQETIDNFHDLYFNTQTTWKNTSWMGIKVQKIPTDLFIYQEILYEVKPDLIIETGTLNGGSAYYLAHICDILGNGKIVTVDIIPNVNRPTHSRIQYILGSSVSPEAVEEIENILKLGDEVKNIISSDMKVLVILDSDHSKDHVLKELNLYSKFVTKGSYLIVEDSCVNGHPLYPDFGPGPMEAIDEFMINNTEFEIDKSREKFMLTFNPNGYLKRK